MKSLSQAAIDRAKALYETHESCKLVARIMRVSDTAICNAKRRGWVKGCRGSRARPMPGDFPIMANRMSQKALCKYYGVGCATLRQWIAICGRSYPRSIPDRTLPIPIDAHSIICALGRNKAATHYGVNKATVTNWKRKLGLPTKKRTNASSGMIGWADEFYRVSRLDRANHRAEHHGMAEPLRHNRTAA
jgi:DNA-binding transcriptional regulator YiaG